MYAKPHRSLGQKAAPCDEIVHRKMGLKKYDKSIGNINKSIIFAVGK
jgi:hypothetical protein